MNSKFDHMIEVLGWVKEGKPLQRSERGQGFVTIGPPPYQEGFALAAVRAIEYGDRYRLKPAPVRRPFTEKEAQRLVGCVLVSPEGERAVVDTIRDRWAVWRSNPSPTFLQLSNDGWHYHLPGHPDDLKPCWVEES